VPRFAFAVTLEEACSTAIRIGFPVTLKAFSSCLTQASNIDDVAFNLASPEAVRQACQGLLVRSTTPIEGFFVQQMPAGGTEVIVGVVDDPNFGPLIGFGLGGTAAEVLQDAAFRITPLTDIDAREMVRSIRGLPLLQGYRGQPSADLEAIEDLLLRVSWLVEELPEVAELDLNPIKVFEPGRGLVPLDMRMYVRP
jgi:acyl-CoA synthetase (NDP forming)